MSDLHRRSLTISLLIAMLALLLVPASSVRAEIIDFDPSADDVPEILAPDELDLLTRATSAEPMYIQSEINPTGTHLLAYFDGGLGFIDLSDGTFTPLSEAPPGFSITGVTWTGDTTLSRLTVDVVDQGQDQPPLLNYYRVDMDAETGEVTSTDFDAEALGGPIVDAGPGLETFLVMAFEQEEPPEPVLVDLGPQYRGPGGDRPDVGLPGSIGVPPNRTLELQQAEFTLALVAPDGTDRRELLALPTDTAVSEVTWSADGSRVAITTSTMPDWQNARPRGDDPLWPGTPNLGSINVQEALGLVPPDQNPLVTGTHVHVYGTPSGAALKTFDNTDFTQGWLVGLAFSPTNARGLLVIATRSELEGRPNPIYSNPNGVEYHLLDADLNADKQLTGAGLDLLSTSGVFLDDDMMMFVVADEVDSRLTHYNLETDALNVVSDDPGAVLQLVSRGDLMVYSHGSTGQPYELWRFSGTAHAEPPSQITRYNTAAADVGEALVAEDVSWQSSDGETLHGVVIHHEDAVYPPEEPGPLVVWQMGGPGGQMQRDYGSTVESPYSVLPHYGLPVFVANAAGRSVKSPDFYNAMADGRNFGQLDIGQIKEGVEHLVQEGVAHPGRVGITGCSYGGYFTFQSMRTYPTLYAAGNPQCSLTDLFEEFTFGYTPIVSYIMGAPPMAAPDEYLRDSPYHGVKDIEKPVLIFHGTDDFLPVQLLNNIHDELDANGVDVSFLRVAGEGHGFNQDSSQAYAAQLQVQFFTKHLIEADVPVPPSGGMIYMPVARRGGE